MPLLYESGLAGCLTPVAEPAPVLEGLGGAPVRDRSGARGGISGIGVVDRPPADGTGGDEGGVGYRPYLFLPLSSGGICHGNSSADLFLDSQRLVVIQRHAEVLGSLPGDS